MARRKSLGSRAPGIGLAYAGYVSSLAERHRGLLDFVEIPFERLCHEPEAFRVAGSLPVILHCASLSVAGFVSPRASTLDQVKRWAKRLRTPWVGEHLAFVTAPGDGGPIEVGYTVAPPLNAACISRVLKNCRAASRIIGTPLILENPPQYFNTPGSTMDQGTFLALLCEGGDVALLLDLSHLLITASNTGEDAAQILRRIPLDRVREIHLSGMYVEDGVAWDDHGQRAPEEAYGLLEQVLKVASPEALTVEYNWAGHFHEDVVVSDLTRVRRIVSRAVG